MEWDNKVVWSEGLFLQPHHFQQQDRYVERLVRQQIQSVASCAWGVSTFEINSEMLNVGKFAVNTCRGIMPDGTAFDIPADCDPPPPLELPEGARNRTIYLQLPERQPGGDDYGQAENPDSVTRFYGKEFEVADCNEGATTSTPVEVAKLRVKFALEGADDLGYVRLPLARVIELRSDKQVALDREFIPPCLVAGASESLKSYIGEVHGYLHFRGETLAKSASSSATGGVSEIQAFLMLQAVNRYEPLFAHLADIADIHPLALYRNVVQLIGEFSTFGRTSRRPPQCPVYDHHDLQATFQPLFEELRRILRVEIDIPAIEIPLQQHSHGFRTGAVSDKRLFGTARFILVAKADMPVDVLRQHFPNHLKIGPVETIRDIVTAAVPGVGIVPMPAAPRQLPERSDAMYFELEKGSRYWSGMDRSRALALHLSDRFADIDLQLWAIKG